MTYVLAGVALLLALLGLARLLVAVPAATLARVVPQWLGWGLFLGGNLLMFTGRAIIGGPMLMAGLGLLRYAGQRTPVGSIPTPGQTSTVRSRGLAMALDHATGALSGTVLAGVYAGQPLDALDDTACLALWQSFTEDGESRALLEAYLDRRSPGWREHVQADHDTGQGRATSAGVMSLDEAYEILGLRPNATETEVREAHRRLMMAVHPDRGGSTFLAARVNEAKDLLIARHKSSSRS